MERRYLVKTTTRATEQNTFCPGAVHTHIFGKAEEMLFANTGDPWIDRDNLTPRFVLEYGYKRESDAKRAYSYKNPERSVYWQERPEIIEVEVYDTYCKEI